MQLTIGIAGIWMFTYTEQVERWTFRGLVFALLGSWIYDIFGLANLLNFVVCSLVEKQLTWLGDSATTATLRCLSANFHSS